MTLDAGTASAGMLSVYPGPAPSPAGMFFDHDSASATSIPMQMLQKRRPPPQSVGIEIPPPSAATDAGLVAALVRMINVAYRETHSGIWGPAWQRTDPAEIGRLLGSSSLAVAFLNPAEGAAEGQHMQPVGCICVARREGEPGLCELSLMTVDPALQGSGLARRLFRFGEEHARSALRCSRIWALVAVPVPGGRDRESGCGPAFRIRLQAWYGRMGYRLVGLLPLAEQYPDLAWMLVGPAEFRVLEKNPSLSSSPPSAAAISEAGVGNAMGPSVSVFVADGLWSEIRKPAGMAGLRCK